MAYIRGVNRKQIILFPEAVGVRNLVAAMG